MAIKSSPHSSRKSGFRTKINIFCQRVITYKIDIKNIITLAKCCNNVREPLGKQRIFRNLSPFSLWPFLPWRFIQLITLCYTIFPRTNVLNELQGCWKWALIRAAKKSFLIFWIINMMFHNEQGVNNSICWANIHVKAFLSFSCWCHKIR